MGYINAYHGHRDVPWRNNYDYGADAKLVGIEFEHEILPGKRTRPQITQRVEEEVNTDKYFWIAERDGSLNQERGLEFVSNPMPYNYVLRSTGVVNGLVDVLKDEGADDRSNDVGLHVNVNVGAFSESEALNAVSFFHLARRIGEFVGGRKSAWNYQYIPRYGNPENKRAAAWIPGGLPTPWAKRSKRLEIRLFKSTTDWPTLKQRVVYALTGVEFAKQIKDFEDKYDPSLERNHRKLEQDYISFLDTRKSASNGGLRMLRDSLKEKFS